MSDDIRHYISLVEDGGYQQRVSSVAKRVLSDHEASPFENKAEIKKAIMRHASHNIENKLGGTAWRDFIKDVTDELKGQLRSRPKNTAAQQRKEIIQQLAPEIEYAAGNAFPDGDPFDQLVVWLRDHGVEENNWMLYLDKAAKNLGAKSYHDYLADMYDAVQKDREYDVNRTKDSYRYGTDSTPAVKKKKIGDIGSAENFFTPVSGPNPWR